MQHKKCDSRLMLDNPLSIVSHIFERQSSTQISFAHLPTYKPQPNHLLRISHNQESPTHSTRHYLHLQHGQVKQVKERPQDPEHLPRQSQLQRMRQAHHQPSVPRRRHQSSRLYGRQSLRLPVALLQKQSAVEAICPAGQALLARDEAESADFSARVRGGE